MTQEQLFTDGAHEAQTDPAQARRDAARRRYIAGAIILRVMREDRLQSLLDRHVWGVRDRALFGLPPRGKAAQAAEAEAEADAS